MSMSDVVDKVLRLRDALETVEGINNKLNELPKLFIVILTVTVADTGGLRYPVVHVRDRLRLIKLPVDASHPWVNPLLTLLHGAQVRQGQ